jgi:hypothetical protein
MRRANKLLVDDGTDNALNLHNPGFRYSTDAAACSAADAVLTAAYQARELADRETSRDTNKSGEFRGQQEGDSCTVNGRSGHLKMVNGKSECVPDNSDAQTVADAYAEYDREAENASRKYESKPWSASGYGNA